MSDDLRMTRLRMYAIIDAFERDMRKNFERFVGSELTPMEALGDLIDRVTRRRDADAGDPSLPLIEFVDFKDTYDLLNRHRAMLPEELAKEIRELTPTVDRLVSVRNRVMHGRPLSEGDDQATLSIAQCFVSRYWVDLAQTRGLLASDQFWEPESGPQPGEFGYALHNLPMADYDDTGLIGRQEDVQRLIQMCKRKRDNVITITGEGGIGKTALALEVAYQLVDDHSRPYDAVLWTSLKTERLTADGVREIRDSVTTLTGGVAQFEDVLGSAVTQSDSYAALADALSGLSVLLIIDNLETVNSSNFLDLYEVMPDGVQFLLTSRVGVGEVERRYFLGALSPKSAVSLFSDFINRRRVSTLQRLPADERQAVVAKLRFSPLAIKWYVLSVESGANPNALIQDQRDLLEFCVRSVFESLSEEGKRLLAALYALGRPVSSDELVLLTGEEVDAVGRGVKELTRGALVAVSPSKEVQGAFAVGASEAAIQFVKHANLIEDAVIDEICRRDEEFRRDEERRAKEVEERHLAPVVVRSRNASDAATAQLLRKALLASQASDFELSHRLIERARALNGEFWEVDRVDAFITAAEGKYHPATHLYQKAYKASEGEHRAIVAHFMAGHYSRHLKDLNAALPYAKEAHEVLQSPETALALGNQLVWLRRFDEGIALVEPTLNSSTGKSRLIAATSLVLAHRRKAEYLASEERSPLASYESAAAGLEVGVPFLRSGTVDTKLIEATAQSLEDALSALNLARSHGIPFPATPHLLSAGPYLSRLLSTRRGEYIRRNLERLAEDAGLTPELEQLITLYRLLPQDVSDAQTRRVGFGIPAADGRDTSGTVYRGEVISLHNDAYGFIAHPLFPENVFFHRSVCSADSWSALSDGVIVEFEVELQDGRVRASYLRALEN